MEDEPKVEAAVTEEEPAPQTETPTQLTREEVQTLIEQAQEKGRAEANEQYKGYQRTVSKREREMEALKQQLTNLQQPQTSRTQEIMTEILKETESPKVAQLEQQLALERARETQATQYQKQQAEALGERNKLEQQIEEAGFASDDVTFAEIWDYWDDINDTSGKWAKVHARLDRKLKTMTPKEEPKPEVDIEKLVEEKARQILEDKGLLKAETGGPSTSSGSYERLREAWLKDEDNMELKQKMLQAKADSGHSW